MPPKKGKGRKRASTEDVDKSKDILENVDKSKDLSEATSESTDLLSPSEVVKMRKKSTSTTSMQETKEKEIKTISKTKTVRAERAGKKDKTKEQEKKKEVTARSKKEKNEKEIDVRKGKVLKDKKRNNKRKIKNEEVDPEHQPVLYPCGICTKEVSDADDAILCEAGCEYWYHRNCTGMTDVAYQLLTNEEYAEWVCDKCIATKSVPLVKIKSIEQYLSK